MQLTEYGFSGMTLMDGERVEFAINLTDSSGRLLSKNAEALLLTDRRVIHLKGAPKSYRAVMTAVHDVNSVEVTAVRRGFGAYVWAALAFILGLILFATIDSTFVRLLSSSIVALMGVYLIISEVTEPKKPSAVFRAGSAEIKWEFTADAHRDDLSELINRLYHIKSTANGRVSGHDHFAPR